MSRNERREKTYSQCDSIGDRTDLTPRHILKLTHHEAAANRGRSLISTIALFWVAVYLLTYLLTYCDRLPSVLWRCWLGGRKGIRPVKKLEWYGTGMVIRLERIADLHMAQLIPLPLTVSCFSKIQIVFTFLVPADPGSPGQRAVKRVYVYVCVTYCGRCEKGARRCCPAYTAPESTCRSARTSETDLHRWRTANHVVITLVTSVASTGRESRRHVIRTAARPQRSMSNPPRPHRQGLWYRRGIKYQVSRGLCQNILLRYLISFWRVCSWMCKT